MSSLLSVAILRSADAEVVAGINANPPSADSQETSPGATGRESPVNAPVDCAPPRPATTGANTLITHAAILPDALGLVIDRNDEPSNTILRARCDDIARRIVRDGGHISMTVLAREIGTTPPTLKRLMNTPLYRETYNRVSDELLGSIDDRIADERLDILARSDTLQRRALTVLSEAMMIARGHMADVADGKVTARPGLLKVAVDAAAEVRQIVTARAGVGQTGSTLNINITKNQATIIQGALRESGVDLSDVLDGVFLGPVADASRDNTARTDNKG